MLSGIFWLLDSPTLLQHHTDESGYTITAEWRSTSRRLVCYAAWEGSSPMIDLLVAMRGGVGWRETGVQAWKLQLHRPQMHLVMLDVPHVMRGVVTMEVFVWSQFIVATS